MMRYIYTTIQLAKLAHSKQIQRERLFATVHYATESDISLFQDYNKSQDFIAERHMHQTSIMRDSTKLGLHLLIASEVKLHPLKFRLWEMGKKNLKLPTYRVCDDFSMKEMKDSIDADVYFIQEFDDVLSNMRRRTNIINDEEELMDNEVDKDDDDELRDELNTFNEIYHDALRDATSLFDELRIELLKSEDQYYNDGEDPVIGCGIGLSNLPLLDLKAFDAVKYDELNSRLEIITNSVLDCLSKCYRDHSTEESLVFIKIYDPQNIMSLDAINMSDLSISQSVTVNDDQHNSAVNGPNITSPSSSPHSTDMTAVFSDEEHDDENQDEKITQVMEITPVTAATEFTSSDTTVKSSATANKNGYIPIKYMGSMILSNSNITYLTLYKSICDFIADRMKFFHVDFNATQVKAWLDAENYR